METYEEFINNILKTRGRFACGNEYHECHHIIPRCMGGTNDKDNLIDLFAQEHFIAHKLLAEENPDNYALTYAWWMMSHVKDKNQERYEITPEEYEEAKITFIKMQSEVMKQVWEDEDRRKKHSDFMREKYSNPENNPMFRRRGEDSPFYGKRRSEDVIESIRRAAKERCQNPEYIAKLSKTQKERYINPENNPMFGKRQSEEAKKKIGDANRGRIQSEETKNKRSESMKEKWQDPLYRKQQEEGMKEVRSRPEYKKKQIESHLGSKSWNALAVINIETNKIYGAAILATRKLRIDNSQIVKCCKGKIKTAGGYNWKYLYDYITKDKTIIPGAITLGIITEREALEQLNKQHND